MPESSTGSGETEMTGKPELEKAEAAKTDEVRTVATEAKNEQKQSRRERWKAAKEARAKAKEEAGPDATWKNFFRVLGFGDWLDKLLIGISSATAITSGVAMPVMFLILGKIVDNFTEYFVPNSGVTKAQFMASVSRNALIIFGLFWARFLFSYISMYCIRISGLRISSTLRLRYIEALFKQPMGLVDVVSPGIIASRITASSNLIQMGISQQFAVFLQSLSLTLGAYVVSFTRSWLLTFVASASFPFVMIVYCTVVPFIIKYYREIMRHNEGASALAFEILSSIRIVTAFSAQQRLSEKHQEFLNKARDTELKLAPLMGMTFAPIMFAQFSTYALTFFFGLKLYRNGTLDTVGGIVTVLFSVMMAVTSISSIMGPLLMMARVASASSDILATIDAQVPDTSGLKDPDVSPESDIHFRGVSFAYPSRRKVQVLDNVDLTFEARKTTAIVGPSGSGKSTIVGLLERWYGLDDYRIPPAMLPKLPPMPGKGRPGKGKPGPASQASGGVSEKKVGETIIEPEPPVGGKILVGDVDLAETDAKWWRSQIGLVSQEPFLFNDTIYQNVAHGLSGTKHADLPESEKFKMVELACQQAFADEFITRLPSGYKTTVGEQGIKLSGGQRQRLAIARAIVKQPTILILDEATSAIDVRTEKIVQHALDRVSESRTTIVIAHRLSTIKKADKIIVLRKGKVEEVGTHNELLSNEDGIYHALVRAQDIEMGAEEGLEEEDAIEDERPTLVKTKSTLKEDTPEEQDAIIDKEGVIIGYKKRGIFRSFGLLLYEQRRYWPCYVTVLVAAAAGGSVYPLQAWIFAQLINAFTITDINELSRRGNFWSLIFFILALSQFAVYYILAWAAHTASALIQRHYRQEYFENILRKRIAFFDAQGNSPGAIAGRLTTDPGQIEMLMGGQMSMSYSSIFNLIGSLIICFYFGWKLALVGSCVLLPCILSAGWMRIRLERKYEKMNAAVFEESSQFATEAVGAFRTVTSLIMEDPITERYRKLMDDHVRVAMRKAIYWTISFALSTSIDMACQAFILWYGGTLLASREYNLIQYFVVYQAITQGGQAAGIWFSFAPNIANATAGANRILSTRSTNPLLEHEPKSAQPPEKNSAMRFDSVHFKYSTRNIPVLTGLDLSIQPGQFIALVGATGCGKSTVISLIERFYDATRGSITYGDANIDTYDVEAFRRNISLVAQESTLYEGTVRENVTLSVDAANATDALIEHACAQAQIHDFITSLPDGYATRLGPKGISLSGGQRQRLALARALMRNPNILLLDEATSSLDSESETLVQEAIEKAAGEGERTVIAVAHRLATIQKADVIYVLGSGKVLESGGHAELLRKKGVYYSMCQAQALDR